MEPGVPILLRINEDPMSRARALGKLVEDLGDELIIEYDGQQYRRPRPTASFSPCGPRPPNRVRPG